MSVCKWSCSSINDRVPVWKLRRWLQSRHAPGDSSVSSFTTLRKVNIIDVNGSPSGHVAGGVWCPTQEIDVWYVVSACWQELSHVAVISICAKMIVPALENMVVWRLVLETAQDPHHSLKDFDPYCCRVCPTVMLIWPLHTLCFVITLFASELVLACTSDYDSFELLIGWFGDRSSLQ